MTTEDTGTGPDLDMVKIEEMIRSLGVVVNNTFLYGEDHGVTTQSIESCFSTISQTLDTYQKLTITKGEEGLMVGTQPVVQKNPLVASLIQRLADADISNLTLMAGLRREEFIALIGILTAKPGEIAQLGGLTKIFRQFKMEHIQTREVTYVEIDKESEEIIAKKEKEELEVTVVKQRKAVKAFLAGAAGADAEGTMEGLEGVSGDSDAMSEIIMEAADTRQKTQAETPEMGVEEKEFAEHVADCVRKAYGELMKTPGLKTQKAKKELIKTLADLEKQLFTKMQEMYEEVSDNDKSTISDAVEGLVDELKIDSLATEYIKKRSAIEANEKKILRYLKTKGLRELADTNLEAKLAEAGLTTEAWQKLLIKSGIGGAGAMDEDAAMAAVGHIAILLAGLDKKTKKAA